jgi:hypothetical protein
VKIAAAKRFCFKQIQTFFVGNNRAMDDFDQIMKH